MRRHSRVPASLHEAKTEDAVLVLEVRLCHWEPSHSTMEKSLKTAPGQFLQRIIDIAGSVANFDFATELRMVGTTATLTLSDGRRLRVIFNRPSRFVGTGGYF